MGEEIERKFLVGDLAEATSEASRSEPIAQGYLAVDPAGSEVRVRRRGDATVMTVKRGSGERRDEVEFAIGADEFERLWELTEGRRVSKRRHYVEAGELTYEIDVYEGELAGLAVVEVEFSSGEEAGDFAPPGWFGRELTGDARYSNASLALDGRPPD
ncbi:MAG: CYTH domain-containing protein [Solirubrobacterales bacterium]|nr:CYTH domain-containing protein [Solirubrobacterales bacterium]MCB8971329.1 CYTH domain-containing protein [Thermoleophilales bacterium]MCO5325814.1 CYTH domain-containing protein [Solirubrobacterales bacterium]